MNIMHELEQLQAFLRDLSPVLISYKKNLMKEGFSEREAFQLVRDYQMMMLQNGKK